MAARQTKSNSSKTKTSGLKSSNTRNTSKKKSSSSRSSQTKRVTKEELMEQQAFHDEMYLVGTLVISILLVLSNFGLAGIVGDQIGKICKGIFGILSYIIPFCLFIGVAFYLSNRGNRLAKKKLISGGVLLLALMAMFQMFTGEYDMDFFEYYTYSANYGDGGGILGGNICKLLNYLFGTVGTYVVLFAVILLCVMLFTGKTFVTALSKRSGESLLQMKERHRENALLRQQYLEEMEANGQMKEDGQLEGQVQHSSFRRKAKTFNLKADKKKYEVDQETGELIGHPQNQAVASGSTENDGQMSGLKGKAKKGRESSRVVTDVDMSEIQPNLENLSITGSYVTGETEIPTYEDELNSKFGKGTAPMDIAAGSKPQTQPEQDPFGQLTGNASFPSSKVLHTPEDESTSYSFPQNVNGRSEKASMKEEMQETDEKKEPSLTCPEVRNAGEVVPEHMESEPGEMLPVEEKSQQEYSYSSPYDPIETTENLETVSQVHVPEYNSSTTDERKEQTDRSQSTDHGKNHGSSHATNRGEEQVQNQERNQSEHTSNTSEDVSATEIAIEMQQAQEEKPYVFPPLNLLAPPKPNQKGMTEHDLKETAAKLQKTLDSFGVRVTITNVSCGPAVTRYELQPEQGVKVSKITALADDIKLNLAAADIRIEAPIPGKAAVGIEVPNKENATVSFRELIENKSFKEHPSDIAFAVGKDIGGQTVVTDIAKMPHLLIAGATGSGKSVCINTLIMSILYKANPNDVKLIMVDPKVVELSVYNGIPHLMIPVVTDPKKASAALNWAVVEMNERYKKFADLGVRDLKGYNAKVKQVEHLQDNKYKKLPQIVIIVDELADLMMVAPGEVEDAICRLAQMARAAGLHLVIATQRPSVNVITGLIKANVPSRIAFSVSSAIDSRTIIDGSGAEKLLGKGDMLFMPQGYPKPVRVQGAFISDKEVSEVVEFLSQENGQANYNHEVANQISSVQAAELGGKSGSDIDDYFVQAGKFIIEKDKASIGMLQRVYKIGFNRAARIMDQLCDAGVVGPEEGTKPRKVIMSMEEFDQYVDECV